MKNTKFNFSILHIQNRNTKYVYICITLDISDIKPFTPTDVCGRFQIRERTIPIYVLKVERVKKMSGSIMVITVHNWCGP